MKEEKTYVGLIIGLVVLFVAAILVIGMFDTVDASHKGVKVRLGEITGTMNPGIEMTGLLTHVEQYDLRTRRMTVEMSGNQGAVDKTGQAIYAEIQVNYRLNPESVEALYGKIGLDKEVANILNVDGIIREGFKSTTSQYDALSIVENRQQVKEDAIDRIRSNFPEEYLVLENVIISNIDFAPSFKNAIQAKKDNEQLALAREKEVDIEKYEANKKIEEARGEMESAKLKADGVSYAIERQAEAEALALRLKKQELNPLLVENNRIDMMRETWDGAYPKMVTGSGTSFLMSMGDTLE